MQLVWGLSRPVNGNLRCDLGTACTGNTWMKVWDLKPAFWAVNPDSTAYYSCNCWLFFLFSYFLIRNSLRKGPQYLTALNVLTVESHVCNFLTI